MALSEPGQDLPADTLALIQGRGQDDNNNRLGGFEDDFYADKTQNDPDKRVDSSMQSNKEVCCQSHPCFT